MHTDAENYANAKYFYFWKTKNSDTFENKKTILVTLSLTSPLHHATLTSSGLFLADLNGV